MPRKENKAKPAVRSTDLNFMVVRGTGKVRRFKVSSRLLMFSFLFFLAYTVVSLFAINRYLTLRLTVRQQAEQVDRLKVELTSVSNKLYEAEQRMALLEHPVSATPAKAKPLDTQQVQVAEKKEVVAEERQADQEPSPKVNGAAEPPKAPQPKQLVDIRDLKVKVTPASLSLAFKVYNATDKPGPVKGYVHIIWLQDSSNLSKAWSYPNIALTGGMPLDYKTGRLFSIRRFREIRASFERKPDKALPRVLRIVAFDKSGEKVFSRDYNLDEFIKNKESIRTPASKPSSPKSTKALLSG